MLTEFHIGIDDTDSTRGGCTTYLASLIFQELCAKGIRPSDFPWLVRLNPNIPWKTRGNAALAIHLLIDASRIDEARRIGLSTVERFTDFSDPNTDPALVFLRGPVPESLREFYQHALQDVLTVKKASEVAGTAGVEVHLIKGQRGIVGSLAAIGAGLRETEHTFEIIAYRSKEALGTPRRVDSESVRQMDLEFQHHTFQNCDPDTGRILVCPHGPDPVLVGIRGDRPGVLWDALNRVHITEPVERIMLFRTNQGTDAHIKLPRNISSLKTYQSAFITGRVETTPRVLKGGHTLFRVHDGTGSIDCVAFARSGTMMRISRELLPGDHVEVSGGVRKRTSGALSLNLEKIKTLQLVENFRERNPSCPACGGPSESMGKNQGLRCKNCRARLGYIPKDLTTVRRRLTASVYIPPPRSRRHLTSPRPDLSPGITGKSLSIRRF